MELNLYHSISFKFGSSRHYGKRPCVFPFGEFTFSIILSDGHFVLNNGSSYLSRDFVVSFIRQNHRKRYQICHYVMYWDGSYVLCSILSHKPLVYRQTCLFN